MIPSGHIGIGFCCVSYVDYFTFTCVADENVTKEPDVLIELLVKNIKECIEKSKKISTKQE